MMFGIASRPALGMSENGDAYLVQEWNGQTLLALIDGLGHGEEAATASKAAREYLLQFRAGDVEQILLGLHSHLHGTRGAVAGLVRIDRVARKLSFCGIGNIEVHIRGEPPMHPASSNGIVGANVRKTLRFEYQYISLSFVALYSDGISSRVDLSEYPSIYENPQGVAQQIVDRYGKDYDDASIVIAVERG